MRTIYKILSTVLAFSIIIYPLPSNPSYAEVEKNKLASSSRINRYEEKNRIGIDTVRFTMAICALRDTILKQDKTDDQIIEQIQSQNTILNGTGITIEEEIYRVKLKKSRTPAICLKVTFPKGEVRWLYFVKDPSNLTKKSLKNLGIITEEDKDYFLNGPLSSIWISNKGPEDGKVIRSKILSSVIIVPLIVLLTCLPIPPKKKSLDISDHRPEEITEPTTDIIQPELPTDVEELEQITPDTLQPELSIEPDITEFESQEEITEPTDIIQPELSTDVEGLEEITQDITPQDQLQEDKGNEPLEIEEVIELEPGPQELPTDNMVEDVTIPIEKTIYALPIDCLPSIQVTTLKDLSKEGEINLYPNPDFICGNNASYTLSPGAKIYKELTQEEQDEILKNGITLITNGAEANVKIKGYKDGTEKTIIFKLTPAEVVDYNNPKPFKFLISPSDLLQHLNKLSYIEIQNLDTHDLILNGLLAYYAIATSPTTVQNPSQIGSQYEKYSTPGVPVTIFPTPNGIMLNAKLAPSSNQYAGIELTPIIKTPDNIALNSTATASSYFSAEWGSYGPEKVKDDCFSADFEGQICEWSSKDIKEDPKPWIQLTFSGITDVYKVVLYDRKGPDWCKNGVLLFSDGGTQETGALPNDGYPNGKAIELWPPKKINWIKFTIIDSGGTPRPGLGEFQVFKATDQTNFLINNLTSIHTNVLGSHQFVLELVDNADKVLSIPIMAPNPTKWTGLSVDLLQTIQELGIDFNLGSVEKFRIVIKAQDLPPLNEPVDIWLHLQGLYVPPPGSRGRLTSDPDLTMEEKEFIRDAIKNIKEEEISISDIYNIHLIKDWPDILTPLGFRINGAIKSAFFIGKDIYLPHPQLIKDKLKDLDERIIETMSNTIQKWHEIILNHEKDEASGITHAEAVYNESTKYNINGLNFADIATILLETFTGSIDRNFYEKFLKNLFIEGPGLFLSEDTFLKIVQEMINPQVDEQQIRTIYQNLINRLNGLITTEINGKGLSYFARIFDVTEQTFRTENGFRNLIALAQGFSPRRTPGLIPIDLNRFFIKNISLGSAITIDTEYLKRFIAFARMLPEDIKILGLTEKGEEDIAIGQLLEVIKNAIPNKFGVRYNVNWRNYIDIIGENIENSVSILTIETLEKIPQQTKDKLKIVAPYKLGYNMVTDPGYEFYAAWEGLDKTRDEFVDLIYQIASEMLGHLVKTRKITEQEKDKILEEIKKSGGIGLVPTYYDPIEYYKTIESQKALIIAA